MRADLGVGELLAALGRLNAAGTGPETLAQLVEIARRLAPEVWGVYQVRGTILNALSNQDDLVAPRLTRSGLVAQALEQGVVVRGSATDIIPLAPPGEQIALVPLRAPGSLGLLVLGFHDESAPVAAILARRPLLDQAWVLYALRSGPSHCAGLSPNPVFRVSPDGSIDWANDAAAPVVASLQAGGQIAPEWIRRIEASGRVPVRVADGRWFDLTVSRPPEGGALCYGFDVTRRATAETALGAARTRLAALLKHLHVGVLVEDEDRRLALANVAFCRMFGINAPPEALLGGDCAAAARAAAAEFPDPEAFVRRIDEVLASGATVLGERLPRADGVVFERDFVPIQIDGGPAGHLWLYRDITQDVRSVDDLDRARAAAEQANAAKTDFLARMSHEIRTPLNAVLGFTEVALSHPVDPGTRHLLERILANSEALSHLVSGILDFSKIEAGVMVLDDSPMDPAGVVNSAVESLDARAHQKGLILRANVDASVPSRVISDPNRFRQVVVNLVSNAVRYTSRGSVSVDLSARSDRTGKVTLTLAVTDTGIGIPAVDLPHIFDRFRQASNIRGGHGEGTGLGLAITRSIVQVMGGQIEVQSEIRVGTRFQVQLPVTLSLPGSGHTISPDLPEEALLRRRLRVLIADDNPDSRMVFTVALQAVGHEVSAVEDGRRVVAVASQRKHDLILMDVDMPEMDGIEATAAIRAGERDGGVTPPVPILGLSAHATENVRQRCLAAGMDAFIGKPIAPRRLAEVVASAVEAAASVLIIDDAPDSRRLLRLHLERAGARVAEQGSIAEALADLSENAYDILLVDLDLPDGDGRSLARTLRDRGLRTAMLAITGHTEEGASCAAAGFDGLVPKPVRRLPLLQAIHATLKKNEPRPASRTKTQPT